MSKLISFANFFKFTKISLIDFENISLLSSLFSIAFLEKIRKLSKDILIPPFLKILLISFFFFLSKLKLGVIFFLYTLIETLKQL